MAIFIFAWLAAIAVACMAACIVYFMVYGLVLCCIAMVDAVADRKEEIQRRRAAKWNL